MMIYVPCGWILAKPEEGSAASNVVERGSGPVMAGSAPRCPNPALDGAEREA